MLYCLEKFNKGEIDADTSFMIEKQMLTDEIDDLYFISVAMGNLSELISYIDYGRVNIRIQDITGLPDEQFGG